MTAERIERIRGTLAALNADALILTSPANRRWATGFTAGTGRDFSTDAAVISRDAVELLVSRNHVEWARGESSVATEVAAHQGKFGESLSDFVRQRRFASIAIEADALPYPDATRIRDALPGVSIEFVTGLGEQWRASKDNQEIASLECAAQVTDRVFQELAPTLRAGETEVSAARRISARLLESADGLAFDVIVASGPNAARPHHRAGDRVIQENETIVVDMGCRIDGYCGDLTRTVWLGEPDQHFRRMYRAVLEAQNATKALMRAGRPVREVAMAADRSLQDSGYGEYILHNVGHGVGLDIHEPPAIRQELEAVLPLNAVVTVEPGVYVPGWGGIRIEDVVVVGGTGVRTLTTAEKLAFD